MFLVLFFVFIPDNPALFLSDCRVIERRESEDTENHKQYVVCLNSQPNHIVKEMIYTLTAIFGLWKHFFSIDRKLLHQ